MNGGGERDPVTIPYVYWQDEGMWLGYIEGFPDYWTQGADQQDLGDHLRGLYKDLTSGEIPNVRRVAPLQVP